MSVTNLTKWGYDQIHLDLDCETCGTKTVYEGIFTVPHDGKLLFVDSYACPNKKCKIASHVILKDMAEYINLQITEIEEKGDISDGSHTFDELYYHRMVLFSIICNSNKPLAWKSHTHADGEVWDGYFIVGIQTPEGHYTYHYQNQYWDMFDVEVLDKAPEWDGHTAKDITRLLSLNM